VGRTGTFLAMGLFKKIIQTENQISVFDSVRQLREQRWGLVYTFSQYEYLYDFVEKMISTKKNK
jgi:protein tyrosine phosphatase